MDELLLERSGQHIPGRKQKFWKQAMLFCRSVLFIKWLLWTTQLGTKHWFTRKQNKIATHTLLSVSDGLYYSSCLFLLMWRTHMPRKHLCATLSLSQCLRGPDSFFQKDHRCLKIHQPQLPMGHLKLAMVQLYLSGYEFKSSLWGVLYSTIVHVTSSCSASWSKLLASTCLLTH